MATVSATLQIQVRCPCGEDFFVGYEEGSKIPVLLHKGEPCHEFIELEPDDFLRWVRARLEGKADA